MSPFIYICFITIVTHSKISEVQSEELKCTNHSFTFIHEKIKNAEAYCRENKCIAKCCPLGEIFVLIKPNYICTKIELLPKNTVFNKALDYSDFQIYKHGAKNKMEVSDKITINQFKFVYDAKFLNVNCSKYMNFNYPTRHHYIMENGELEILKLPSGERAGLRKSFEYCMEYLESRNNTIHVYHILDAIEFDYTLAHLIIRTGLLLSSFFLFLTLLVYFLLPYLRNINGMIQMGHVGGLMITFLLRVLLDIKNRNEFCYHVGPLFYFFVISNFLWLAIMSFNIWWSFRGTINHRLVHRAGELVKFIIYSVSVYGLAGALTICATVIDRTDLSHSPNIKKPGFTQCLTDYDAIKYYMYGPIAILIIINSMFFVMTLYNIWKIKKGIEQFTSSETRKNQVSVSSFKIYVKLSLMMGISWVIEVVQTGPPPSPTIFTLANLYNAYIGIIIFIVLITDKKKIVMLCKRFNIKHKWIPNNTSINNSGYSSNGSSKKKSGKTDGQSFQTVELNTCGSPSENNNRNSK